jgi:hypothetical protein
MHILFFEKQKQAKLKSSRWKEIIKIRAEIKDMKSKRTPQRISETKCSLTRSTN